MGLSRGKLKGKHSCVLPEFGLSFKLENKSLAFCCKNRRESQFIESTLRIFQKKQVKVGSISFKIELLCFLQIMLWVRDREKL